MSDYLSSLIPTSEMKNIHKSFGRTDEREICTISQGSNTIYTSLYPKLEVWATP